MHLFCTVVWPLKARGGGGSDLQAQPQGLEIGISKPNSKPISKPHLHGKTRGFGFGDTAG